MAQGQLDEKSESTSQYVPHEGNQKAVRKRPSTNIKPSQEMVWNKKANEYRTFAAGDPKMKMSKSMDNIKPLEGQIQGQSETKEQLKGHQIQSRPRKAINKDKIGQGLWLLVGKLDSDTEAKNQYKATAVRPKEKALRPSSNIGLEGEMNFDGHPKGLSKSFYQRPAKAKMKDNLRPLQGQMTSESESQNQFQAKNVQKQLQKRPSSNIPKAQGQIEDMTDYREKYVPKDASRPSKLPRPSTTLKNSGELKTWKSMQELPRYSGLSRIPLRSSKGQRPSTTLKIEHDNTIFQKDLLPVFNQQKVQKAHGPQSNLKYGGLDFQQGTENNDYLKFEIKPRERPKNQPDHLKANEGSIQATTTNKENFQAFEIKKKAKATAPPDHGFNRSKSADSSWSLTSQQHDYKQGFNSTKPEKVRVGTTLKRPSGKIEGATLYKEAFQLARSVTDLRIRPNWYQDLTTPYGEFAQGKARTLGAPALVSV